jgi:kynureninase
VTDFADLRTRFPLLGQRAYFATQCLGPLPEQVFADLEEYGHSLALRSRAIPRWLERLDEITRMFERLLGAPQGSVALKDSATAAQAAIAAAISPRRQRNRILYTSLDFHSSRYLWAAQARRGFEALELVPSDGAGFEAGEIADRIDERVAVVALSLVSPRTGALVELRPVIERAREHGALVVVDAYQAVGVVPIDVVELGVDVLVGGSHKWLCGGGTGLAFLYVRPEVAAALEPVYPGWLGHAQMSSFSSTYVPAEGAVRFQQGTVAIEPIYSARAGLTFVLEAGVARIAERSRGLAARIMESAARAGVRTVTPRAPARHAGMVCFDVEDPPAVVERLAAVGIDVDCRPQAGVRASAHACNTEEECDRLVEALVALT